ncbi:uncharacterized protein LOC142320172 [Lycorma delicatula]|uniref:uncharacterized protein LOC142320172 n=1 Tax=Lycorma delicatula TaxID=130591 RepID=UPI003F516F03
MSPAPQGGLEVERYIGSCLISQSARSPPGKQFLQNKSKKAVAGDGTARQFVFNPRDSASHAGGPRYSLPPIRGDFYPQHGWAGMPLFCMASNNQRRNRKGPIVNNRSPKNATAGSQNKSLKCSVDLQDLDGNNRSPLSRLAIHTQGAPLIQAGRYNKSGFNRGVPPLRLYRGGDAGGRRSDSSREVKVVQNKEPGACDSVSVASDESSTNSENSLPRIIKPRKRRKKDRKPPATPQPVKSVDSVTPPVSEESKSDTSVKAFTPTGVPKVEVSIQQTVETVLSDGADTSLLPGCGDDLPSELDQDDGPASTCQCRYCDPAGVIWDVDQRCYSPFLTPPSPTELKLSYSFRGYDLGSALRRSWSEPSSSYVPPIQQRTRACSESQTQSHQQPQSLEVSSEIITSPNGHRDIEIKFFSPKPNGTRQFKVEE